jgi:2-phosphosulfolactate phosphatase
VDAAAEIAKSLENPLMAGEIGGNTPFGFEMNNSPAEMAVRSDVHRPAVLVTSSGTLLAHNASASGNAFLACFRNLQATVRHLSGRFPRIAVIGAGSRAEFREEDQMCCAQVAEALSARGYLFADHGTEAICRKWEGAHPDAWLESNSVRFLRSTDQGHDLDFILNHRDDLDLACAMVGPEAVQAGAIRATVADIPARDLPGRPSPVGTGT